MYSVIGYTFYSITLDIFGTYIYLKTTLAKELSIQRKKHNFQEYILGVVYGSIYEVQEIKVNTIFEYHQFTLLFISLTIAH